MPLATLHTGLTAADQKVGHSIEGQACSMDREQVGV